MKKSRLLTLAFVPFLLVGCQKNADPNLLKKDVEVKMVSHFGENFGEDEYKDTCFYSDYWFLDDSSKVNYELAVISAMTGAASYSNTRDKYGIKITNLLSNIGFVNIQANEYYTEGVTLENSIGVIAAQKTIKDWSGKEYTLLAIFPRNAGYYNEWVGNFDIGKTGIHNGFLAARDEMLRFMKHYITSTKITGDLKVWSAGYSRGAAVANLVGGYLCDDSGYFGDSVRINKKDVFTYTIGTPRPMVENLSKAEVLSVSGPREGYLDTNIPAYKYVGEGTINPTAEQYKGIHNFVAVGDFISKLPTAGMGFTRYGETNEITYGEPAMIDYVSLLSPETAAKFYGGKNYATVLPTRTFDLKILSLVDGSSRESADQMLENRFAALMGLGNNSRDELVDKGYTDVLGALTAIFGNGIDDFLNIFKSNIGDSVKAAVLTYLAYASEKQVVEDNQAVANIVFELLNLIGKPVENRETYNDQQLLKDLFDYLFNDTFSKEEAAARSTLIASLIPAPYNDLYTDILEYAKQKEIRLTYVDDLLYLVASYATDNKEDETVKSVVSTLAGLIPEQYVSYLSFITGKQYPDDQYPTTADKAKAGVTDILELCAKGNDANPDYVYRSAMLSFVIPMAVGTEIPEAIMNLLANGAKDSEGVTVTRDPLVLSAFADAILKFALPKDEEEKTLSLADSANKAICDLLDKGVNEKTEKYINILKEHPDKLRNILVTLLFNPGDTYSLANDIEKAVTFVDTMQFLFPAHNHEMYISYLKVRANEKKPN